MRKARNIHNKILIIFIAGIGDLILFTPVLKGLLRHDENCEISIIVPPELVQYAGRTPYFADVVVSETSNEFNPAKRVTQLIKLCIYVIRKKFDIVITPLAVKCTTAALLSRLSRAERKIGYTSNNDKRSIFTECINIMPFEHDLLQNLKALTRLHINSSDKKMEFHVSESDRRDAQTFLKDNGIANGDAIVALHPVTYDRKGYNRNWPAERFAQLGYRISREYGMKVIIMGSSGERKVVEGIKAFIGKDAIVQAGKTSIHVAAAILERCKLLICNDSSIMHIAATIGTPMVAIWGLTDPRRRGYSGNNQIVMKKELSCSPCREKTDLQNCETRECLLQISVEEVFDSCRNILSKPNENPTC